MRSLVAILLVLSALSGLGVVLSREPRRMVPALGANGLVLACLFMVLQAPDVAFAELVVGAVAAPLLFLVVLARMRIDHAPGDPPGDREPRV
jgi:energy-converting hydrogenase B subunit D